MADELVDSGNRATVAQTLAEVRGLKDLFRAEIGSVQRQLDLVTGLPVTVAELKSDLAALDKREIEADADMDRRVGVLETSSTRDRDYRRIHLPSLVISAVLALGSIIALVTQLH